MKKRDRYTELAERALAALDGAAVAPLSRARALSSTSRSARNHTDAAGPSVVLTCNAP